MNEPATQSDPPAPADQTAPTLASGVKVTVEFGGVQDALSAVFAFNVLYNLAAGIFCLGGLINPLVAAILMPLTTVATVGLGATVFGGSRQRPTPSGMPPEPQESIPGRTSPSPPLLQPTTSI